MFDLSIIELVNSTLLTVAVISGLYFLFTWRKETKAKSNIDADDEPRDRGGYIKVEIPPEHRSLFHDFLKGFEDFAGIRGYKVSFSVDSSADTSFCFKYTIHESGVSVSADKVRKDFNDYLKSIESGKSLDDLPVITTQEEHDLLLTKLKNRINFLQHSYNLSRNTIEYYERILKYAPLHSGIHSPPPIIVQTVGQLDSRNYKAEGARNIVQGDNPIVTAIENDYSVKITNSFNERRKQLGNLTELIELLQADTADKSSQKAAAELEKVREELQEEQAPDSNRVGKWLKKASEYLDTAKLTREVIDKTKEVYGAFNVASWIEKLAELLS